MWYPVALFITLFSSVCWAKGTLHRIRIDALVTHFAQALDSDVLLPRNLSSIDTTIVPSACMADCYGILMTVYVGLPPPFISRTLA